MNRNLTIQLISAAALVIICLLLINPLHAWMPDNSQEMMLAGAAVVFGILAGFVFSERGGDERGDAVAAPGEDICAVRGAMAVPAADRG